MLVVVLCLVYVYQRKKYLDMCCLADILEASNKELEDENTEIRLLSERRMEAYQSVNEQLNGAQADFISVKEELVKAKAEIALLKSKLTRKPKDKTGNSAKTEKK